MGLGRVARRLGGLSLLAFAALAPRPVSAAVKLVLVDAKGALVDLATSNASIERTPPVAGELAKSGAAGADPDALRYVVVGPAAELPVDLAVVSRDATGARLDSLDKLLLGDAPCPPGTPADLACRSTPLVRCVADDVDRNHPLVVGRSIRGEVGGILEVVGRGSTLGLLRVGGPRDTPAGPLPRLRGRVRVTMVRDRPRGSPPFGGDDANALSIARRQLAWANALWGQCGIQLTADAGDVRIVDPPTSWLLALGCDLGLPASGGEIRVRIDGKDVRADLRPGMRPRTAARVVARAVEAAGFSARVSENARIDPGADGSADVLVRRKDGQPATIEPPPDGRASTDATMTACIGELDLSDGLEHFTDVDAPAGTVEERTLVKACEDGDPTTIDVVMITSFSGGGRIGESFIAADGSSVRNVILEDRAGVRADRASFALAHELGHVLLDMPGHPDDYGADTPTLLMDSDAADPSAFGPRRITLDECARAFRQSGPGSSAPLLTLWPFAEPKPAAAKAAVTKRR